MREALESLLAFFVFLVVGVLLLAAPVVIMFLGFALPLMAPLLLLAFYLYSVASTLHEWVRRCTR